MAKEKKTDARTGEGENPPEPPKPDAGLLDKLVESVDGLLEKVKGLTERQDKTEKTQFDLEKALFGPKETTEPQE